MAATSRAVRARVADAVLVRTPGFYLDPTWLPPRSFSTTPRWPRASQVPVLLYNFTAVTGVTIPIEAVAELARHPEHHRHEGIQRRRAEMIASLVDAVPPEFRIVAGSASTFLDALGAPGAAGRHPRTVVGLARGLRGTALSWRDRNATTKRGRSMGAAAGAAAQRSCSARPTASPG